MGCVIPWNNSEANDWEEIEVDDLSYGDLLNLHFPMSCGSVDIRLNKITAMRLARALAFFSRGLDYEMECRGEKSESETRYLKLVQSDEVKEGIADALSWLQQEERD